MTVVPCSRATEGIARSRRVARRETFAVVAGVARVRSGAGDDGPGDEHRAREHHHRDRDAVHDAGHDDRGRLQPSGTPARATRARARRRAGPPRGGSGPSRTAGRAASRRRAHRAAPARSRRAPAPRRATSRSRRRGARTSEPSTATMTAMRHESGDHAVHELDPAVRTDLGRRGEVAGRAVRPIGTAESRAREAHSGARDDDQRRAGSRRPP